MWEFSQVQICYFKFSRHELTCELRGKERERGERETETDRQTERGGGEREERGRERVWFEQ